jgi:hypothetical protein
MWENLQFHKEATELPAISKNNPLIKAAFLQIEVMVRGMQHVENHYSNELGAFTLI